MYLLNLNRIAVYITQWWDELCWNLIPYDRTLFTTLKSQILFLFKWNVDFAEAPWIKLQYAVIVLAAFPVHAYEFGNEY